MNDLAGEKGGADTIVELSARRLAALLRGGEITAVEALETQLERVWELNGRLNAVVSLDAERALEAAKAADETFRRGKLRGPLHGVPITLKDGHDVAGLRTTLGSPHADRIAERDGAVAARLRAAGAIIIGHTNVPPMLGDIQSANPLFGRTGNPWDPNRTPGGSSGGAAAAVAASMTPLEVGSDLAGSMRLPAHFCGVYGLKTTEHRVPSTGFFRLPGDAPRSVRIMSALGPIARDLDDLDLALRIIAGPDGRDPDVPPVPLEPRGLDAAAPAFAREPDDLRLAVAPTLPGIDVAEGIRRRVREVAAGAEEAGSSVERSLPEVDWDSLHALFGDLVATITGILDPGAALRDEQRSLAWYLEALTRRDRFAAAFDAFFHDFDALLLPAAATSAFTHRDTGAPIEVDGEPTEYWQLPGLTTFCNLAGLPSLVVPAGTDADRLPIGLQIVGPRWSEMRLLEIARALEIAEILPGFRHPSSSAVELAGPP